MYFPLSAVSFNRHALIQAALRPQRVAHARHVNDVAFGLPPSSPLRAACIYLISSKVLGSLVFCALLLNLVVLFVTLDPLGSAAGSPFCEALRRGEVEVFLSALFTAELFVKLCALGLFGRRGFFYKHRPQRPVEALLVVFSWVSVGAPAQPALAVVRALRTIRLLDFFDFLPDMSIITATIATSGPMLLNVLFIISVECLAFGLLAVDLWRGTLDGTCAVPGTPPTLSTAAPLLMTPAFCVSSCGATARLSCKVVDCPAAVLAPAALNFSEPLPWALTNVSCATHTNINWGSTNFDTIYAAAANAFVMLSTEGWASVMYRAMATSPHPALVAALFVAHILLGAFFFIELALAVVVSAYVDTVSRETLRVGKLFMLLQLVNDGTAEAAAAAEKGGGAGGGGGGSGVGDSGGGGLEGGAGGPSGGGAAAAAVAAAAPQLPSPNANASPDFDAGAGRAAVALAKSMALWSEGRALDDTVYGPVILRGNLDASSPQLMAPAATARSGASARVPVDARGGVDLALMADGFFDTSGGADVRAQRRRRLSSVLDVPTATQIVHEVVRVEEAVNAVSESRLAWLAALNAKRALRRAARGWELTRRGGSSRREAVEAQAEEDAAEEKMATLELELEEIEMAHSAAVGWRGVALEWYKRRVPYLCSDVAKEGAKWVVRQPAFRVVVCLLCLVNAGLFAASGAQNSQALDDALYNGHVVILALFLLEWIVKLVDKGPRLLFSTPFNCVDAAVVGAACLHAWAINDMSLISVLRLSRVLYEAHLEMWGWQSLRLLVGSLGYAARMSLTSFTLLLVVLLTFSFSGMALFRYGPEWNALSPLPPRMNYGTFGLAFVTTFQMMDNENWDSTVKAHVAVFGWTAVVFFTLIEVVGNLLFLNLLIALLVGAMGRYEEQSELKLAEEKRRLKATELELEVKAAEAAAAAAAEAGGVHPSPAAPVVAPSERSLPGLPTPFSSRRLGEPPAHLSMTIYWRNKGQGGLDAMCLNIPHGLKAAIPKAVTAQKDVQWWAARNDAKGVVTPDGLMRVVPAGHIADPAHPNFLRGSLVDAVARQASNARQWAGRRVAPLLAAPLRALAALAARTAVAVTCLHSAHGGGGAAVAPAPPAAPPPAPGAPAFSLEPPPPAAATPTGCGGDGAPAAPAPWLSRWPTRSRAFTHHPAFEFLSNAVLILSCVSLAIDSPALYPCAADACTLTTYLWVADVFFAAFFSLELALSLLSLLPRLRDWLSPWLLLDMLVVAVTIVGATLPRTTAGSSVRALRSARALRALKLIKRVPAMRLVVMSMVSALPRAKESVVVISMSAVAFAVAGMFILRRKMSLCNDPAVGVEAQCVGSFNVTGSLCEFLPDRQMVQQCKSNPWGATFPRLWQSLPESFDTLPNALLTVFELASGENWPVFFMQMVDALSGKGFADYDYLGTGRGWDPISGSQMALWTAILYHVSLQVLMNQLLVELFSGVMIDTYMNLRGVFTGLILLTPVQRTWMENMRVALLTHGMLVPSRPPAQPAGRPKFLSRLQLLFFRLSQSPTLHALFIALTFGNIVTMCLQHAAARADFERSLRLAEAVFVGLFCCETVIKIVGLGARGLARWQFWVFDALPLAGSAASLSFGGSSLGTLLRLLRLPRLARLLSNKGLTRLIHTLVLSLPGVGNAMLILAMNLYIWACIGMNLFSGVHFGSTGFLNAWANFDSFPLALLTCFRCITGENFNGIMRELMRAPPYCEPPSDAGPGTCIPYGYAGCFFVAMYTVSVYILVQVLIAILFEAYNLTSEESTDRFGAFRLNTEASDQYVRLWAQFDVESSMQLDAGSIALIICELNYPLGLRNDPRLTHLRVALPVKGGARSVLSSSGAPLSPNKKATPRYRSLGNLWSVDHTAEAVARRQDARLRIPLELQVLAVGLFERLGLVPSVRNKYNYYTVLHALISRASQGAPLVREVRSSSLLRATIVRRAQGGADSPSGEAAADDHFSIAVKRSVIKMQQMWRELRAARSAASRADDAAAVLRLSPVARRAAVRK